MIIIITIFINFIFFNDFNIIEISIIEHVSKT